MKASLSEIFSALRGITRAGVPLAQTGASTKTNPIARLAADSASLQYDVLFDIIRFPEKLELNVAKVTRFLTKALPDLQSNGHLILASVDGRQGGTVSDVVAHIGDILAREGQSGRERAMPKILKNQSLANDFHAAYLPQAKSETAKPVYEEIDRPESPRRPHRKGGRPKKQKMAEPV